MALASSQVGEDSLSVGAFAQFVNFSIFGMCSCFWNHLYALQCICYFVFLDFLEGNFGYILST
jgi:hypothetical protein